MRHRIQAVIPLKIDHKAGAFVYCDSSGPATSSALVTSGWSFTGVTVTLKVNEPVKLLESVALIVKVSVPKKSALGT